MDKPILIVALVAAAWHLTIMAIIKITSKDRKEPSLERILRLIELELVDELDKNLKSLPQEKKHNIPYQTWIREINACIRRSRKNTEKSD